MILHRSALLAWLAWDSSGFFQWLAKQPWYTELLTDWTQSIPIPPKSRALELGCGPGVLSALLETQGVCVTGLDRSAAMVDRARSNAPQSTFLVGDAQSIALPDDSFDIVFAASVVNVVPDPKLLVCEMARVTRPGGPVSVLFPTPLLSQNAAVIARQQDLGGFASAALGLWGSKAPKREPDAIVALFREAGFESPSITPFWDGSIASVTGRLC